MWLLPWLSAVSRFALRAFYRLEVAGGSVPAEGPVLLVANHPNSLLDPAAVAVAARRPVRFLAKAPLFDRLSTGWLVRAAGAVPVHRRQDAGARPEENLQAFRAVEHALAGGHAVGIFPEGRSHFEPTLAPLKTGAARIALGTAARTGAAPAIVPVGLVLARRERFRSPALVLVGGEVAWEDLRSAGSENRDAVRELTARIAAALRAVTVNLERWEDHRIVSLAEAIHAAEHAPNRASPDRVRRLGRAADVLSGLRARAPDRLERIRRDVGRFGDALEHLHATVDSLDRVAPKRVVLWWILRQVVVLGLGMPVAAVGAVLFHLPYRLTGAIARRVEADRDALSTWAVLAGGGLFALWTLALALATVPWGGWPAGLAALLGLPLLALVTLATRDRWSDAVDEARRYLLLGSRSTLRARLLRRRRELARELEAARADLLGDATVDGGEEDAG